MGWNCTITVVDHATLDDLARIGWRVTDATLAWDEASTSGNEGIAAWVQGDRLVLASGGLELVDETERLASLGQVWSGLLQSVTDTYEWRAVGPELQRRWVWQMYEPVLDEGEPHPAEAGLESLDEDSLLTLLERVAGLRFDEGLEEATFVAVEPPPAGPVSTEQAPPRKCRWFGGR